MNETKLVGFDPQIFKEQKQVVEAIIDTTEDAKIEFEENIENLLDYLENENEAEDVEEDGKQEE